MPKRKKSVRFVSRGGDKLDGALDVFGLDINGQTVADLGANVGGFTDCVLQRGARCVYAVDTGYGVLDWKLRQDERVVVMERVNALHVTLPEPVNLTVIDVGWTPMVRILPVALGLVAQDGCVVALLKPQYEARDDERANGVVLADCVENIVNRVVDGLISEGIRIVGKTPSSVVGSGGNQEYLLLAQPT